MRKTIVTTVILMLAGCSTPDRYGPPGWPEITALDPVEGIVGSEVVITGTRFGASAGTVSLGSVPATVLAWSAEEIRIEVPDVRPGARDVVVVAGENDTDPASFAVVLPRIAYVNDDVFAPAENSVSAFSVLPDGTLAAIGVPWKTGGVGSSFGGDAGSVKLHASSRRLFASNDGSIAVFDVSGRTGALTAVPGSPFPTGGTLTYGVAVTADGRYLYAANAGEDTLSGFSIHDATGALTPLGGSPWPAGSADPFDSTNLVVLGEGDRVLYSLNQSGQLAAFRVNASGTITPVLGSPWSLGSQSDAYGLALDPTRTRLYVAESTKDQIHVFDLDAETGAPTAIAGSPFTVDGPAGMTFTPSGDRLYVTSWSDPDLQGFVVDASGAITPLAGSPFQTGFTGLAATAFPADGAVLLVLDEFGGRIGAFTAGAALSPIGEAPTGEEASHRPSGLTLSF